MTHPATPELWRPVPDYDGVYDVSSWARVWSIERRVRGPQGTRRVRGRVLRTFLNGQGYPTVRLMRNNVGATFDVHKLVARAFLGEPPPGQEVRHLDGDRTHPVLSNLRYGSRSENANDKRVHGTNDRLNRTKCPYGHLLQAPNLRPAELPARKCRACSRAASSFHYHRRRGRQSDIEALRDHHYRLIMGLDQGVGTGTSARPYS